MTENKTSQVNNETKATENKTVQTPFGAWAMPAMPQFPTFPEMPKFAQMPDFSSMPTVAAGVEAWQKNKRDQVAQVEKMMDEYSAQEKKAVEQARTWMAEAARLQQVSFDYAMNLQAESRKAWRTQMQQVMGQMTPKA